MAPALAEVTRQVAQAHRALADGGLATGVTLALGHASRRVPCQPDRVVGTGREYALAALAVRRAEAMVVGDTAGVLVDGPPGITQGSAGTTPSCRDNTRPDVQSVVQVHPRRMVGLSVLRLPLVPMCQEGRPLVRHPLPVYPHVTTIPHDAEGLAVARRRGDGRAIILQGRGAVTTGNRLAPSVTAMLQLEEQARRHDDADCAMGREHPRRPEACRADMTHRPPLQTLPHGREVRQGRAPQRDGS
jgi:ribulose-5-phosphate 4-epimerase/fuculose-1-phosphate aldolase